MNEEITLTLTRLDVSTILELIRCSDLPYTAPKLERKIMEQVKEHETKKAKTFTFTKLKDGSEVVVLYKLPTGFEYYVIDNLETLHTTWIHSKNIVNPISSISGVETARNLDIYNKLTK